MPNSFTFYVKYVHSIGNIPSFWIWIFYIYICQYVFHFVLSHMYGVCPDNFRKTWITCYRLFGEVAWLNSFYSTLCLQIFLLQLFPPISHLICRRRPAIYLSLLTPSLLSYSNFVRSLSKARKSLRGFRKLFRSLYHDQALTRMKI